LFKISLYPLADRADRKHQSSTAEHDYPPGKSGNTC